MLTNAKNKTVKNYYTSDSQYSVYTALYTLLYTDQVTEQTYFIRSRQLIFSEFITYTLYVFTLCIPNYTNSVVALGGRYLQLTEFMIIYKSSLQQPPPGNNNNNNSCYYYYSSADVTEIYCQRRTTIRIEPSIAPR